MPRGIPNSRQAKDNPVLRSGAVSTEDLPIGRTERTAPTAGNPVGEPVLIAVAERMPDDEKAAMLQFMEEQVTIRPTRCTDPGETVFEITLMGRPEFFRVGQEKTVARKYVDHMLRMKTTSYVQREEANAEGIKHYIREPRTVLAYEFEMVRDPHPRGPDWLRATRAMGG
jgi:hypothetical protein